MSSNYSGSRACVTAAVLCIAAASTFAADAPVEKKGWETTAAAGVTLTRGNSETFLATLSLDTLRKWEKDEVMAGVNGAYGDNSGEVNTKAAGAYGQYNRLFSERLYGGIRLDGKYDGIAGVDYRIKISPLVGYYVVKTPKTSLSFEAGPSAVFEKLKGEDMETYFGVRFGERFEHKLTDTTKIWQTFEYIPRVDRWTEKYLLNGEIGIDTAITKQWSLRVVLQDSYDSLPAAGRKHNDLRLLAGTAYKF